MFFHITFSALKKIILLEAAVSFCKHGHQIACSSGPPRPPAPIPGLCCSGQQLPHARGSGVCQGASFLFQSCTVMIRPKRPLLWRRLICHTARLTSPRHVLPCVRIIRKILLYVYQCLCAVCVPGAHGNQNAVSEPLEV